MPEKAAKALADEMHRKWTALMPISHITRDNKGRSVTCQIRFNYAEMPLLRERGLRDHAEDFKKFAKTLAKRHEVRVKVISDPKYNVFKATFERLKAQKRKRLKR